VEGEAPTLTRNHRQEGLCRAYVRAIAAQAGVLVCSSENDYGIDLSLREVEMRGERRRDLGPQIDLQLKATTRANLGPTHVSYDLEVVNYDDLRDSRGGATRLLVVLLMPADETAWLEQTPEQLVLRHCAYWHSLAGEPPTTATTTVRVSIPLANIFSASAIHDHLQR
jgi:hypothetical protein